MPCSCCAYEAMFDEKQARKDASRYHRKGLDKAARTMVGYLMRRGVVGDAVLEVGGGVGAIQLELLKAGAARATNVELSGAYDETAHQLLDDAQLDASVDRRIGDFVEIAEDVEPADDVVLHKVVCCYPNVDALVGAAADHTRQRLVLTYPPDIALARALVAVGNFVLRVRGNDFRAYVWPIPKIVAAAEARGLRLVSEDRASFAWRWAAFER
jgi:hypothetical protein